MNKNSALMPVLGLFIVSACSTHVPAPVSTRTPVAPKQQPTKHTVQKPPVVRPGVKHHVVAKGETLYSIAFIYAIDYRDIARWNNIDSSYTIYPNQSLRLTGPPIAKAAAKKPETQKPKLKKAVKKNVSPTNNQRAKTRHAAPTPPAKPIVWQWPTKGKLFKSDTLTAKKGLNILGKQGQIIKASALGSVVYSGSGILGYGKLVIIKHNETYLSAYAHNRVLLVKEGDHVAVGQRIAEMGEDKKGRALLHFEIRKNGSPVNPMNYLPERQS